jgi:pre-peptidase
MTSPRARSLVLLPALVLGGCAWAPFDESLLDRADAAAEPVEDRVPGAADDPTETARTEEPDAGAGPTIDAGTEDVTDARSRRGLPRTSGELEPNDSMATAQPVGLFYTVLAEWTPAGDDDWYAVDLLAGDVLDIRTRSDAGDCDFDSIVLVYLEGARPAAVASTCASPDPAALVCVDDSPGSSCASTSFLATDPGTYFVRVVEYGDDEHALYTIDFELQT